MTRTKALSVTFTILAAVFLAAAAGASSNMSSKAAKGKELYQSAKFKCFKCHGPTGAEGGMGPSFKGVGKKYTHDQLMERAAHNCPPTGACDPKQLGAIVEYLRTL
ncbi:MAG: c-type cytochrome [Candidatus Nitrospinota bacterium M3_3B_026]